VLKVSGEVELNSHRECFLRRAVRCTLRKQRCQRHMAALGELAISTAI
jgi:hypothetical protein